MHIFSNNQRFAAKCLEYARLQLPKAAKRIESSKEEERRRRKVFGVCCCSRRAGYLY